MKCSHFRFAAALEEKPVDALRDIKKAYVNVGEDESWEMFKSFAILRSVLHREGLDDLEIRTEIVAGAGHVGAMPISL